MWLPKKQKQSRLTENTPRKPQQPGDRDHLETAFDETRPTRSPTLTRFHRPQVCGNRPCTALAISENDECHTHTQTDKLNNGTLCAPRYKRPRSLRSLGVASLLVESYMRQGTARTCSRPCAFEEIRRKEKRKKKQKKSAPPKTHHEPHSRPATATNSRRRATKHVPRGSP